MSVPNKLPHIVPPSHNFQKAVLDAPIYRMMKYPQLSGSTSVTTQLAGTTQCDFEIPARSLNWSKSYLAFTATQAAEANKLVWQTANNIPIASVRLMTRGGVYLCNLDHVRIYSSIVRPAEMKLVDFLSKPAVQGPEFTPGDLAGFTSEGIGRNDSVDRKTVYHSNSATPKPGVNVTEPAYVIGGGANAANPPVGQALIRRFEIFFGDSFPNTIFALPFDMWFPEILVLQIVFEHTNRWSWTSTSAADPTAGAAAAAAEMKLTNVYLNIAFQQNDNLAKLTMDKFSAESGLPIPYVYTNRAQIIGTSGAVNLRFTAGYGQYLRKIYSILCDATETIGTTANDFRNDNSIAGAVITTRKLSSFQTLLDNAPLQNFIVDASDKSEDWELMRPLLRGTALGQSKQTYKLNWHFCDDFTGMLTIGEGEGKAPVADKQEIISGIPLSNLDKLYAFKAEAITSTTLVYNFSVVTRTLKVVGGNILVV